VVEYKRAFAAIRRDPQWKRKIGLGVLIALIPYVGAVWMVGWEMEYQRNVAWGDDETVPGWTDFSRQALLGLKGYVAVLPYSFGLSLIITPLMILAPLMGFSATDSGAAFDPWGLVLGVGATMLVSMALLLLLIPFTSSAMLRVALYGTIGSGFEFKEIWRRMRSHRDELMRAWAFSAFNTGLSLAVMLLYFGALGLLIALIPGSWEQKAMLAFPLGGLGYVVYLCFGMALSLYLALANMHYFGSYGRAAYRLDEVREYYAATAGFEPAEERAGTPSAV